MLESYRAYSICYSPKEHIPYAIVLWSMSPMLQSYGAYFLIILFITFLLMYSVAGPRSDPAQQLKKKKKKPANIREPASVWWWGSEARLSPIAAADSDQAPAPSSLKRPGARSHAHQAWPRAKAAPGNLPRCAGKLRWGSSAPFNGRARSPWQPWQGERWEGNIPEPWFWINYWMHFYYYCTTTYSATVFNILFNPLP